VCLSSGRGRLPATPSSDAALFFSRRPARSFNFYLELIKERHARKVAEREADRAAARVRRRAGGSWAVPLELREADVE
jgi:hypothetical protein